MAAINIYTDGACIGNPGPGGFAAIINTGGAQYTISGGEPRTTNNRMEIRAALEPLQALNGLQVEPDAAIVIHSDSAYLVNAFSRGWIDRWRQNGWRTRAKRGVKNRDLWVEILEAVRGRHVLFAWIRGHSGHAQNEMCDSVSNRQARRAAGMAGPFIESDVPQAGTGAASQTHAGRPPALP